MNSFSSENLSAAEATRRYVLSALIFAFFFANPGLPAWITFIGIYPFATAVIKWDPINALFESLANRKASKPASTVKWQRAQQS